jgi:hypothetical protein
MKDCCGSAQAQSQSNANGIYRTAQGEVVCGGRTKGSVDLCGNVELLAEP